MIGRRDIAIVGLACEYPDAQSPEALWETALARRRAFRAVPNERLSLRDYAPGQTEFADAIDIEQAAVLEGYEFDRVGFRVSGEMYRSADITHWLALDVAGRALTSAGFDGGDGLPLESTRVIVGNSLTGELSRAHSLRLRWPYVRRVVSGVLSGVGIGDPLATELLQRLEVTFKDPFTRQNAESLAGALSNTIAGRICNHFDLGGGGYTVDGACASSLLAVCEACSALAAGDVDCVMAGGVDVSLDPMELVGFSRVAALAKDEMRVYDATPTGFLPGEGCGFAVLMRREDAVAAGRHIIAVVRGWGVSSDGSGGITRPEASGQMSAIQRAFNRAGFGIDSVAYFEGHGTGTAVGDAAELEGLSALRRAADGSQPAAAIGSIKANIGHTKAAAGIAGLIKASMSVSRGVIPPTTGCRDPHPALQREGAQLRTPEAPELWPGDQPRRAGVSAMGFGGINTHVVIEAVDGSEAVTSTAELLREYSRAPQDAELFLFVGDSLEALCMDLQRVRRLAENLSVAETSDLASALGCRNQQGDLRAAIVASDGRELAEACDRLLALSGAVAGASRLGPDLFFGRPDETTRIGFLFPGQGVSVSGRLGPWRNRFPDAAHWLADAETEGGGEIGTAEAQPAIVKTCLAGLDILEVLGIDADVSLGHSLGEMVAMYWAGMLSEADLVALAAYRGDLMQEYGPHGSMAMIPADEATTARWVSPFGVHIAACNGVSQTVIGGDPAGVRRALQAVRSHGVVGTELQVKRPFHTPLMSSVSGPLEHFLAGIRFQEPSRVTVSTVSGEVLESSEAARGNLVRQVTERVRFGEALRAAAGQVDLWVEVGPGDVLSRIVAEQTQTPSVATSIGGDSLRPLLRALAAAFVFAGKGKPSALFAGRFSRSLDLDRVPVFIKNPCESAPGAEPQEAQPPEAAMRLLPESRDNDEQSDRLDDPGTDTRPALDIVVELVAERAELPIAAVSADDRLLGDLHLNSISISEIVGEASKRLGRRLPLRPTQYTDATVGGLAEALLMADAGKRPAEDQESNTIAGLRPWVEAFELQRVEAPELHRGLSPGRDASGAWKAFAPVGDVLSEPLTEELENTVGGNGVVLCVPPALDQDMFDLFVRCCREVASSRPDRVLVADRAGAAGALAKTLFAEIDDVDVTLVRLPAEGGVSCHQIAREVRGTRGFSEVTCEADGGRYAPLLCRLRPDELRGTRFSLSRDDVLLVSGGGKGITAECAFAVAKASGCSLLILGRSDPDKDRALADNLRRLGELRVTFHYEIADVCDGTAVLGAVQRGVGTLGEATGILHGAGVNEPVLSSALVVEDYLGAVAPKVEGLQNLLAAVDPRTIRLVVSFGSIVARSGLPGEAHYGTANEWLALTVERYAEKHPGCRCLNLEWSIWSGVGMGERLGRVDSLEQQGITPIPPDEGVKQFLELLATPDLPTNVIVCGRLGDLPTLPREERELASRRFLERPRVHYPGIELIADAEVSAATDPYLSDHVLDKEPLFPAVMGLEAMAQVAAALAGCPVSGFEEVEFLAPIVVPEDTVATIRVAAQARSATKIDLVVRCSQTAFAVEHFRATADVSAGYRDMGSRGRGEAEPAQRVLDSAAVLYDSTLFHTGRFRRVEGYRSLSSTACAFDLEASADSTMGHWFSDFLPPRLDLGDPGARDAAIHGIQACIPQQLVLPVGVERIVLTRFEPGEAAWAHAVEREDHGDLLIYDVEVMGKDGRVVERWEGLQLRTVAPLSLPDPCPTGLLSPYLERSLGALAEKSARVAVGRVAGGRSARTAWVEAHLPAAEMLLRRADGKPLLSTGAGVSIAHCGELVVAATGSGWTAVDAEECRARTESSWSALLGTRFDLARLLSERVSEPFDVSATRVWTALECLSKSGVDPIAGLIFEGICAEKWVMLRVGEIRVLTKRLRVAELDIVTAFSYDSDPVDIGQYLDPPANRRLAAARRSGGIGW